MIDTTAAKTMIHTVAQAGSDSAHVTAGSSAHLMSGMSFSIADFVIIALVLLSAAFGLWRGFVKETLSLFIWVLAVWVALNYSSDLAQFFATHIHHDKVRYYLSFVILMIVTLIVGGLVNMLLVGLIKKTGLSFLDRFFGLIFGIARGLLIVALLLLIADFTTMSDASWWKDSTFIPYFTVLTHLMSGIILAA